MPHSHHSHSGQFCKHAKGSLEEVVQEAIRRGFQVYGLTEHVPRYRNVDLYPEEEGVPLEDLYRQFDAFLDEAYRLKEKYQGQITLLVGLETEYITDVDLDKLDEILKRHGSRIQYLVGSIHHVNGIPIDFDQETYQKSLATFSDGGTEMETQERFLCAYFDAQFKLLQRFHPEIIGHVDLCRLYHPQLQLEDYPSAMEKLERNIKYAVEYGALFEANAAAFRKGWDAAYPGHDVLKLILRHGGRCALSDDSHGPHAVGLNYHRLKEYLYASGVHRIWYLEETEEVNEAGRSIRPTSFAGGWWEHRFWRDS